MNLIEMLGSSIGDIVRDPKFLQRTEHFSLDDFHGALEGEMKTRGIEARLIYVKDAPAGSPNDQMIRWQPFAGGDDQVTWFSRTTPTSA